MMIQRNKKLFIAGMATLSVFTLGIVFSRADTRSNLVKEFMKNTPTDLSSVPSTPIDSNNNSGQDNANQQQNPPASQPLSSNKSSINISSKTGSTNQNTTSSTNISISSNSSNQSSQSANSSNSTSMESAITTQNGQSTVTLKSDTTSPTDTAITVRVGDTLDFPATSGMNSSLSKYDSTMFQIVSNDINDIKLQAVKAGSTTIVISSKAQCLPGQMCPMFVVQKTYEVTVNP